MTNDKLDSLLNKRTIDNKVELIDDEVKAIEKRKNILDEIRSFNNKSKENVDKNYTKDSKFFGAELKDLKMESDKLHIKTIQYILFDEKFLEKYYKDFLKTDEVIDSLKNDQIEIQKIILAKKDQLILEKNNDSIEPEQLEEGHTYLNVDKKSDTISNDNSNQIGPQKIGSGELKDLCEEFAKELGLIRGEKLSGKSVALIYEKIIARGKTTTIASVGSTLRDKLKYRKKRDTQ